MKLSFSPVDMLLAPNNWSLLSQWSVLQGAAERLYLQLQVMDSLGVRRYIPASGTTVTLTFTRARSATLGTTDTAQTVTVSCTSVTDDRSMWYADLTAAQVTTIITGTVKATVTEGTTVYVLNKAYAIKKTATGTGC